MRQQVHITAALFLRVWHNELGDNLHMQHNFNPGWLQIGRLHSTALSSAHVLHQERFESWNEQDRWGVLGMCYMQQTYTVSKINCTRRNRFAYLMNIGAQHLRRCVVDRDISCKPHKIREGHSVLCGVFVVLFCFVGVGVFFSSINFLKTTSEAKEAVAGAKCDSMQIELRLL